jgi:V8-like Glu-specific endopeptidase
MQQDNPQNEKAVNNEQLGRPDPKESMHQYIGALTFRDRYNRFLAGTATLISPNTILTAAHNVYDKKYSEYSKDFKSYLGACGEVEEYYEIESWRMME